jgi:CBS domain-containing protein
MESKVSEILKEKGKDVFSVTPDTSVFDAVSLMAEKNIGALIVMVGDQIKGIVTERDYARKIILKELSPKETLVKDVMTVKVASITTDSTLAEAMVEITANKCRHLPVFEDNKLVGLISIGNMAERMIKDQAATIKELNEYIAGNWEQ